MFKLGVITDEISQDFGAVVQVCKDYELEAVEILPERGAHFKGHPCPGAGNLQVDAH